MDRFTVLAMFSWQYLLMSFLACLGIVQLTAGRSGRRHLWLLPRRRVVLMLGSILIMVGVSLFYLIPLWSAGPWGPPDPVDGSATWTTASVETLPGARHVNDTEGGLSGHWQALWFAIGWIGAVFFARSVGRIRRPVDNPPRITEHERILVDVTSEGQT